MTLVALSIAIMIAITDGWVDPKKDRPLLETYPLLAGILPIMSALYHELLRVAVISSDFEERVRVLSEKAAAVNDEFDDACRTFHSVLTSLALVSGAERRALVEKVRDTLMPDGLAIIKLSYLEKSGIAETVLSQMKPEWQEMFEGINLDGQSLFQLFSKWTSAGQALGDISRQRSQLVDPNRNGEVTAGDAQKVRYKWVRTVHVLVRMLELESDIPEDVRYRLLQPLRDAEAQYASKRNRNSNEDDSDEDNEPASTDEKPEDVPEEKKPDDAPADQ